MRRRDERPPAPGDGSAVPLARAARHRLARRPGRRRRRRSRATPRTYDGSPPAATSRSSTRAVSVCRACPRLVALARGRRRDKRASYAGEPYWGRPIAGWGVADARRCWSSGSRRPRTAATAPAGSSPATAPGTGCSRRCTGSGSPRQATSRARRRRPAAARHPDGRRRALRAAGQQADAPPSATPARRGWSARWRSCAPSRAGRWSASGRTAGTPRCAPSARSGTTSRDPSRASGTPPRRALTAPDGRAVPLLGSYHPSPAEHLHRQADRADARRRAGPGRRAGRGRMTAGGPRIPTAEEEVLKTLQCGFESHRGHQGRYGGQAGVGSAGPGDARPPAPRSPRRPRTAARR